MNATAVTVCVSIAVGIGGFAISKMAGYTTSQSLWIGGGLALFVLARIPIAQLSPGAARTALVAGQYVWGFSTAVFIALNRHGSLFNPVQSEKQSTEFFGSFDRMFSGTNPTTKEKATRLLDKLFTIARNKRPQTYYFTDLLSSGINYYCGKDGAEFCGVWADDVLKDWTNAQNGSLSGQELEGFGVKIYTCI
jgi:hypothetical protein